MDSLFLRNIADHLSVMEQIKALDSAVQSAVDQIAQSMRGGGKVMFCGNGGSAADSQHLAAEFTGRFIEDRRPLAALALSTDTSALTCIGNDYSFDDVFSRQVIGLGRPGDCLVGISTSGNSRNVLKAVQAARAMGITCIGLLGRMAEHCGNAAICPSSCHPRSRHAFRKPTS
jgi:D-sedoheptulose 7-phosphate isomerase